MYIVHHTNMALDIMNNGQYEPDKHKMEELLKYTRVMISPYKGTLISLMILDTHCTETDSTLIQKLGQLQTFAVLYFILQLTINGMVRDYISEIFDTV